jgi:hypothetical protein
MFLKKENKKENMKKIVLLLFIFLLALPLACARETLLSIDTTAKWNNGSLYNVRAVNNTLYMGASDTYGSPAVFLRTPATPTTVSDVSGNGRTLFLTVGGGTSCIGNTTDGIWGTYPILTNKYNASCTGNIAPFNMGSTWTVEGFERTSSKNVTFAQKWNGTVGWVIGAESTNGYLSCRIWDTLGQYWEIYGVSSVTDDVWHSFACRKTGNNLQLWRDGLLENQVDVTGMGSIDSTTGSYLLSPDAYYSGNGKVTLDEFRITLSDTNNLMSNYGEWKSANYMYSTPKYFGSLVFRNAYSLPAIDSNYTLFDSGAIYLDSLDLSQLSTKHSGFSFRSNVQKTTDISSFGFNGYGVNASVVFENQDLRTANDIRQVGSIYVYSLPDNFPNMTLISPDEEAEIAEGETTTFTGEFQADIDGDAYIVYEYGDFQERHLCGAYTAGQGNFTCSYNTVVRGGANVWYLAFHATTGEMFTSPPRDLVGRTGIESLEALILRRNATCQGDGTGYMCQYKVMLNLPESIDSPRYIYFYARSPRNSLSNEKLICLVKFAGNKTYTAYIAGVQVYFWYCPTIYNECTLESSVTTQMPSGIYFITCDNYMYDSYGDYDELPHEQYWYAVERYNSKEEDGANLISKTGVQNFFYNLSTAFATVYPPNGTIYVYSNRTALINELGGEKKQGITTLDFVAYFKNKDGTSNLTIYARNSVNGTWHALMGWGALTTNSEDYYKVSITYEGILGILGGQTTIINGNVTIPIEYYATVVYGNSTITTTPTKLILLRRVTGYEGYPFNPALPINQSSQFGVIMTGVADSFGVDFNVGVWFFMIIMLLVLSAGVAYKAKPLAGAVVFVIGLCVFSYLGWLPFELFLIFVILAGLIIAYYMRKVFLARGS